MAVTILQVAYDPAVLECRRDMLEDRGYFVTSALGNPQAMEIIERASFDLIVVGFSAPLTLRSDVVRWLKQHAPRTPVVALLSHEFEAFPNADCATMSEDPAVWLASVGLGPRYPEFASNESLEAGF